MKKMMVLALCILSISAYAQVKGGSFSFSLADGASSGNFNLAQQQIIDYYVIDVGELSVLAAEVNKYIKSGYVPYGYPVITFTQYGDTIHCVQAMVKYKK